MKSLLSLVILCFSVGILFAQDAPATQTAPEVEEAPLEGGPIMEFDATEVDYGTIEQNADPLRVFNFKNNGDQPLVIKHAKGSCGCTVPTYPKEPIMPGETGVIEVRYDTKRIGPFTKSVTLTTNEAAGRRVLKIKGKVNKPAEQPASVPASSPSIFSPEQKKG